MTTPQTSNRTIIVDGSGWGDTIYGGFVVQDPQHSKIATVNRTHLKEEHPHYTHSPSHSLPYVKNQPGYDTTTNPARFLAYAPVHRSMETMLPKKTSARRAVDELATYVNTSDKKDLQEDFKRAQARFRKLRAKTRPASADDETTTPAAIQEEETITPTTAKKSIESAGSFNAKKPHSHSLASRDASSEWGWFADFDSSSDSIPDNLLLPTMRRGNAQGPDGGMAELGEDGDRNRASSHILCDEAVNTRITAAHKTFAWTEDEEFDVLNRDNAAKKIVSAAISIPKFRIVQSKSGADRHAEYLVTFKLGNNFYQDWRRYSEFSALVKEADSAMYPRSHMAWKNIDTRWFNRLEPSYLHRKCVALEGFVRELMYESVDPTMVLQFLGGESSKVNVRPSTVIATAATPEETAEMRNRPAAQLPKDLRPPQPPQERELFEKLWAENFKRSMVPSSRQN